MGEVPTTDRSTPEQDPSAEDAARTAESHKEAVMAGLHERHLDEIARYLEDITPETLQAVDYYLNFGGGSAESLKFVPPQSQAEAIQLIGAILSGGDEAEKKKAAGQILDL